jgi:hypothetical protein
MLVPSNKRIAPANEKKTTNYIYNQRNGKYSPKILTNNPFENTRNNGDLK